MSGGRAPLPGPRRCGCTVAGVFVNRQTPHHRPLRAAVAAVAIFAFVAASCSDDKNDAASATTSASTSADGSTVTTVAGATTTVTLPMGDIVATALTNHVFTELAGLAVDAGLVQALRGGPFTVFAPTDMAFDKLPLDMLHAVQDSPANADGVTLLQTVLLHHVVDGAISPDQLAEGELTTLAGDKLTVTKVGDQFFVDGNPVGPGVEATNGWVYVMSDVLVPSLGTIVDAAVALQDCCFGTLVALVTQAGLVETLSGDGPFTVFAPADAAFEALPAATVRAVTSNDALLTTVLTHHVVAGKITTDQLTDGMELKTVAGDTLKVTIVDGVINIDGNPILVQNVQASNGVIHVMGAVLVPAG